MRPIAFVLLGYTGGGGVTLNAKRSAREANLTLHSSNNAPGSGIRSPIRGCLSGNGAGRSL